MKVWDKKTGEEYETLTSNNYKDVERFGWTVYRISATNDSADRFYGAGPYEPIYIVTSPGKIEIDLYAPGGAQVKVTIYSYQTLLLSAGNLRISNSDLKDFWTETELTEKICTGQKTINWARGIMGLPELDLS